MCIDENLGRSRCKIIYNNQIAEGVFEIVFESDSISSEAKPGQFVNLYSSSGSMLLPRPISICEVNPEEQWVKLVYAVVGEGTKEFSTLGKGSYIDVLGPVGNGYTIETCEGSILVGGGVGTPPLLELAKRIEGKKTIYLGFRSNPYLINELKKYGEVFVATDDGSEGHHGTVIELMNQTSAIGQRIYACGPKPMLKALQQWAAERNIPTQLSLEERMGCGFGACVGCVCKIKADNEVGYIYKKVCKDGPVFDAKEVLF
ncbi:MAG: dihydroorotate dehydrogenase electron transfer subunit [Firmicutes bacterium HGW-Firmicutes-1]|jgi:dihydroorotate dehydrogenase electron transfer subunit|nr:MAG: dihydroorotate dehydrogenase electron transfer subunit [Firmicutes bacterium HGW-Firmicutes-1]